MADESIKVFLDGEGKWRWRHRKGSRTVNSSSQGYANKWGALENLRFTFGAVYEVKFQSKKNTPNGRMYQQGELKALGGRTIHVEVTPWQEER